MSIQAIKIDRTFSVPGMVPELQLARTVTMITLAVSAIVSTPATALETSADLRQYFLENAAPLNPVLDDIRELVMFNIESVTTNAYKLWVARYNLVHDHQGSTILFGGHNYNQAVMNAIPGGAPINELKITVDDINNAIALIRLQAGLVTGQE